MAGDLEKKHKKNKKKKDREQLRVEARGAQEMIEKSNGANSSAAMEQKVAAVLSGENDSQTLRITSSEKNLAQELVGGGEKTIATNAPTYAPVFVGGVSGQGLSGDLREALDEIDWLFLKAHRPLVLKVFSFYHWWDTQWKKTTFKLQAETLLASANLADAEPRLNWLRAQFNRWGTRLAFWLHARVDSLEVVSLWWHSLGLAWRALIRSLWPRHRRSLYAKWVEQNEKLDLKSVALWQKNLKAGLLPPHFLVVLVNPNGKTLRKSLSSILEQAYPHWKIAILEEGVVGYDIKKLGMDLGIHERLKIEPFKCWGEVRDHIAKTKDQYILFIHGSGQIPVPTLRLVADFVQEHSDLKMIYADQDYVDSAGHRSFPEFHPDYNLDYSIGRNVFENLAIMHRSLLENSSIDSSSKSWDLIFDTMVNLPEEKVGHIPRVLFHDFVAKKNRTTDSWFPSAQAAVVKKFQGIKMELGLKQVPRLIWPIAEPNPLVSVIVPSRDQVNSLRRLVQGVLEQTSYKNLELIIVDHQTRDPEAKRYLRELQNDNRVKIIFFDRAFNQAEINNFGAAAAKGEILAFLNNDIEILEENWLQELVREAGRTDVGVAGAKLFFKNGFVQHGGIIVGLGEVAQEAHVNEYRNSHGYCDRLLFAQRYSAVKGACLAVRRQVFQEMSGFDAKKAPIHFFDVDFCLRVDEAGYKVIWTPYAQLAHSGGVSKCAAFAPQTSATREIEVQYMKNRWSRFIEQDRWYSPNLTRVGQSFELPSQS